MSEADTSAHPGEEAEAQAAIELAQTAATGEVVEEDPGPDITNADESNELLAQLASRIDESVGGDPDEPEELTPTEPSPDPDEPDTAETPLPPGPEEPTQPQAAADEEGNDSIATAWARAKKAQRENRQLQKDMRAMQERLEQIEGGGKSSDEELLRDPLGYLEKRGLKLEHLNDRVLADGKQGADEQYTQGIRQVREENQQLRGELKQVVDYLTNQQQQQAVTSYRAEVSGLLETEDFRVLASLDEAVDEILEHAGNFAEQNGRVPSAQEAALAVQNVYRQKLKRLGSYDAVLDELGFSRNSAPSKGISKPQVSEKQNTPDSVGATTLSNEEVGTSASVSPNGFDDWDDTSKLKWLAKQIPDETWPST